MDPRAIRFLSMVGVIAAMSLSGVYFYKTWQNGEPRWYFLVMCFAIALILLYNVISIRKRNK